MSRSSELCFITGYQVSFKVKGECVQSVCHYFYLPLYKERLCNANFVIVVRVKIEEMVGKYCQTELTFIS